MVCGTCLAGTGVRPESGLLWGSVVADVGALEA